MVDYGKGNRPKVQPCGEGGKQAKVGEAGVGKGRGTANGGTCQKAQGQKPEEGARREWYEIEDDPEMLCEEWEEDDGEEGEVREEETEGPSEVERAAELVQIKKQMLASLRDTHGRGHAVTKRASEELREAEDWLRQAKGPRPWWIEVTKEQRRKAGMEKAKARIGEKMDAELEWFQGVTYDHEGRMEGLREQWDDYTAKIRESEAKIDEIRREPNVDDEEDDAYPTETDARMPREEATTKMRDIAGHLVKALETVSGNEKAEDLLNALGAQLGELEGILRPVANREGRGQNDTQERAASGELWPRVGNQMEKGRGRNDGKGGGPNVDQSGAKGGGKGCWGEADRGEPQAQHKWARRGTRRGRGEGELQDGAGQAGGDEAMDDVEGSSRDDARRQRALDKIRARLLLEKTRKAAEMQAKAVAEGTAPEPHLLSKEQLEENQRRVEATNREVDVEAERELASMSREQLARFMEEEWEW